MATVYRVTHPEGLWYYTTAPHNQDGAIYKEALWGCLLDADADPVAIATLLKGKYIEKVEGN